MVDLRAVGDEAMLLDEVAGELGEPIAFAVAVKYRPKDQAEIGEACADAPLVPCSMLTFPMRHASKHHKWKSVW